ncbi:uncharacterized protein [Palaemon carinicauda]|uniref:uncharacterized protein n=1 Tax=Palaemon carinicauda TaxID=392227 RepID=UPI0035B6A5B1
MPWQLPNEKIQITYNVGHPTQPSIGRTSLSTTPMPPSSVMSQWSAYIHIDVLGPLPTSKGHHYLFTVTDCSTRWPVALSMETAKSASCSSALLSGWIARLFYLYTCHFKIFSSHLWISFASFLGITVHQTTAYNPDAKGMVESFHRTLKAALISRCKDSNWFTQLSWVLLGLRTITKDTLIVLAAGIEYDNPLVVLIKFSPPAPSCDNL